MIRSFFMKLGVMALASIAIAASGLTGSAQADVIIASSGIGGRAQMIDRVRASCWHKDLDIIYLSQPWRGLLVTPANMRYRGVSGEAVYARVRIKQLYSTGWQDKILTSWQQYKFTQGLTFGTPQWYFFNWQKGVQWEGWDGLAAGSYAAYVEYRWYAGGQLVGTATVGAERSDWEVLEDGWGHVARLGPTVAGQVGYCTLPV
jgi:hypothetical protein